MAAISHPLDTARAVAAKADHVKCNRAAAKETAQHLLSVLRAHGKLCSAGGTHDRFPPGLGDVERLHWVFALTNWNFFFWPNPGEPAFGVTGSEGQLWTGARAMAAAVRRAHNEGIPVCKPEFYSVATRSMVERIFRSDTPTPIPHLEQRWKNVEEVGRVLKERFNNSVVSMVEEAKGNAWDLVMLVAESFPCYRDVSTFKGESVSFLKRAQIFVSDLHFMFEGTSFGKLEGMERLTMFPDYRVPQSLQYFGVLQYSDELLEKLKREEELNPGSPPEVEIRACSILSVEMIREELQSLLQQSPDLVGLSCKATDIDYYLWSYAKSHASDMEHLPIHHTRTIFY